MQKNYNENLVAGAAIRDDKGRRISKLFESPHPKMTVGYAKNLIMPDTPTEQEFNFRQSGGGVIEDGVAVIDKVKGNSVVWNQLFGKGVSTNGEIWDDSNNGFFSIASKTFAQESYSYDTSGVFKTPMAGHKVLIYAATKGTINGSVFLSARFTNLSHSFNKEEDYWGIGVQQEGDHLFYRKYQEGTTLTNFSMRICFYDLTQMFGAGNEPSTYEEFLSRKPKVADEYAYNEGTIVNNKVEAIKTSGVNLWNEEWEVGSIKISTGEDLLAQDRIRMKGYLPVLPNTSYYCTLMNVTGGNGYFCYYDQNKKFIAYNGNSSHYEMNKVFTTPSNCYFVRFYLNVEYGKTYNHDVCINLSDPAINGKYFPYEEHTLDLSWVKDIKDAEGVKLFEDGMKSAGTAFDEVGKNKAVKRIRKYVFDGSEPISGIELNDDGTAFKVSYFNFFETTSTGTRNAVSIGAGFYSQYNGGYYFDLWAAGFASVGSYIICVPSSVAKTKDEIKEYLKQKYDEGNPLVVYYELATPIEVEYDEKNLTYPVVAGGTEEAIASEPSTAFLADIGYGIDAVKTILDLKARVKALEEK